MCLTFFPCPGVCGDCYHLTMPWLCAGTWSRALTMSWAGSTSWSTTPGSSTWLPVHDLPRGQVGRPHSQSCLSSAFHTHQGRPALHAGAGLGAHHQHRLHACTRGVPVQERLQCGQAWHSRCSTCHCKIQERVCRDTLLPCAKAPCEQSPCPCSPLMVLVSSEDYQRRALVLADDVGQGELKSMPMLVAVLQGSQRQWAWRWPRRATSHAMPSARGMC